MGHLLLILEVAGRECCTKSHRTEVEKCVDNLTVTVYSSTLVPDNVKVRLRYAAQQNATKCGLATHQMAVIRWTSMWCGLGRASVCRRMPSGVKIRSAKCWSHQRFAAQHIMSKWFQNHIS